MVSRLPIIKNATHYFELHYLATEKFSMVSNYTEDLPLKLKRNSASILPLDGKMLAKKADMLLYYGTYHRWPFGDVYR